MRPAAAPRRGRRGGVGRETPAPPRRLRRPLGGAAGRGQGAPRPAGRGGEADRRGVVQRPSHGSETGTWLDCSRLLWIRPGHQTQSKRLAINLPACPFLPCHFVGFEYVTSSDSGTPRLCHHRWPRLLPVTAFASDAVERRLALVDTFLLALLHTPTALSTGVVAPTGPATCVFFRIPRISPL